jgi:hypothetical protein
LNIFNAYFDPTVLESYLSTDPLVSINPTSLTIPSLSETQILVETRPGSTDNLRASLTFNWLGKNTNIVPVIGTRLSIAAYQAESLWQEVWEWKTQVISSYNGSEQRIKLKDVPRVSLTTTYPIPVEEKQIVQNRLLGWMGYKWAVPMWTEATKITTVYSGATEILVDLSDTELLEGGQAILWSSIHEFEIIDITNSDGTTATLELPVAGNYPRGYVMPVRTGTIFQGMVRETDGYSNKINIPYQLDEIAPITEETYTQYLGFDVDTTTNLAPNKGIISDNIVTRVDRIDLDSGITETISPWSFTRIIRIYTVENKTHAETIAFKKWLFRRCGKFRPFWMPTFEHDFTLEMTGSVMGALTVRKNGYVQYATNRKYIAIKLKSGEWLFRKIEIFNEGVVYDTIIIDEIINVDRTEILMLSYLTFKRLDTDRIEIEYSNGLTTASIRTIEIEPLEIV